MIVREANRVMRLRDMCKGIERTRPFVRRQDVWLRAWGHGKCYVIDGLFYVFPCMHGKTCLLIMQTDFCRAVLNTGIVEL